MNFSFTEATVNDSPLIRELASKTWEPTYGSILSPEQLDYMFEMMYSLDSLHRQMEEWICLHSRYRISWLWVRGIPMSRERFMKIW